MPCPFCADCVRVRIKTIISATGADGLNARNLTEEP